MLCLQFGTTASSKGTRAKCLVPAWIGTIGRLWNSQESHRRLEVTEHMSTLNGDVERVPCSVSQSP